MVVNQRCERGDTELKQVSDSKRLVASFGSLNSGLEECKGALPLASLPPALPQSSGLLMRNGELQLDLQATNRAEQLTAAFRQVYELSDDEQAVLNAPLSAVEADLTPLFSALERVGTIYARATELLTGRHQPLGLQLTALMAAHQERGFSLLYRSVVAQCQALPTPCSATQLHGLERAGATLSRRPELLRSCAEDALKARTSSLARGFSSRLVASSVDAAPATTRGAREEAMVAPLHDALASLRTCLVADAALMCTLLAGIGSGQAVARLLPAMHATKLGNFDDDGDSDEQAANLKVLRTWWQATEALATPLHQHVGSILSEPAESDTGGKEALPSLCAQLAARHQLASTLLLFASYLRMDLLPATSVAPEDVAQSGERATAGSEQRGEVSNDEAPAIVVACDECARQALEAYGACRKALALELSRVAESPNREEAIADAAAASVDPSGTILPRFACQSIALPSTPSMAPCPAPLRPTL